MSDERFRLRVNATTREFEIEGDGEFVEKYWSELKPLLSVKGLANTPQPTVAPNRIPDTIQQVNGELPDTFGQYFSSFGELSHTDQALIAGYYHQETISDDSSFNTAGVNGLLIDQGVKLANTSECISRLRKMKKVFNKAKRVYAVSKSGREYIHSLLSQEDEIS